MVALSGTPESRRLAKLLRHVEGVRLGCETMGEGLIARGEFELGRDLIRNGRIHDASKFAGIEWSGLGDADPAIHEAAWRMHVSRNLHHPEAWSSIHAMTPVYLYELVADWHARSSEFGTDLRSWVSLVAMPRFAFGPCDEVYAIIQDALGLLLEPSFAP